MLAALRERASAEEIEEAEIEAAIAEHEAWNVAGLPGGTIPYQAAMAGLLGRAEWPDPIPRTAATRLKSTSRITN